MANLDPRGLIGRICVGDHYTLIHIKYVNCGPHGFKEEDFFSIKSIGANDPPEHGQFGPQGLDWQDYVGGH